MADKSGTNGKLPTNIEKATQEYITDHLASWDAATLAARAARLGLSLEEASQVVAKPFFLVEAEKRAEREKRSVDSILQEILEQVQKSSYPTVECISLDGVQEYVATRTLPETAWAHVANCSACTTLLASSLPPNIGIDDIIEKAQAPVQPPPSPAPVPTPFLPTLAKWAKVAIPAVGIAGVAYLLLWQQNRSSDWPVTPSPNIAFVALAGLFFYLVCLVGLRSVPRYRALANGIILGSALAGYLTFDAQQNREIAQSAFQWTRAEGLVLASMQSQQTTGEFLAPSRTLAPTNSTIGLRDAKIDTTNISSQAVKYVVTPTELPGQIVADVQPDTAVLKWETGDKVIKEIKFLTGTVEPAKSQDSDGEVTKDLVVGVHRFKCASCALLPESGSRIVAAVDLKTSTVENYLVISHRGGASRF